MARADLVDQRGVGGNGFDFHLGLADLLTELLHRAAELFDLAVGDLERVEDLGLGNRIGTTLNHQDSVGSSRDDKVHLDLFECLFRGIYGEVTVKLGNPHRADVGRNRDV